MCRNFSIKCRKNVLPNSAAFLLENTLMVVQNAAGITKCVDFITKRGRYYKARRLLQNAAQQHPVKQ